MRVSICARLFERLNDLIPNLCTVAKGAAFCTTSRIEGDMVLYCNVSKTEAPIIELQIAHDERVNEGGRPTPWLCFRVDTANRTAESLIVEDGIEHEVADFEAARMNPRRHVINLFVVNWLTIMLNLNAVFQTVGLPVKERSGVASV